MTILVYPQAFDTTPEFKVVMNKDLLTSAEQTSDEPQTIEYEINPDAAWSDGTPITGKDFIYNWKLQNGKVDADVGESDPEAATPDDATIPDVASTTGYENIESVEGEDKTVTVTFETPYADWKGLFGNIMPAHILKDVKGWNESLDEAKIPDWSGGPFKFENYQPEKSVTMVPNEEFWGEKPKIDELVVVFGLLPEALPRPSRTVRSTSPTRSPRSTWCSGSRRCPRSRARSTSVCRTSTWTSTCSTSSSPIPAVRQAIA